MKADFDRIFQEKLVQIVFFDHKFATQIEELIKFDYFDLEHLSGFMRIFYSYKKEYGIFPQSILFGSILKLEMPKKTNDDIIVRDKALAFLETIKDNKPIEEEKYIKDKFLDFVKNKALIETFQECIPLIERNEVETIRDKIGEVLKMGIDQNFGHDYFNDFEDRYRANSREVISTGWKEIDAITKGGLAKKELSVIIGSTGSGKSFLLTHLVAEAVKQGLNAIYYSFELSEGVIGQRIDGKLSGIALDLLEYKKDVVESKINNIFSKTGAILVIKDYPQFSVTVQTLKNHIHRLKSVKNFYPDLVAVDYGDLLKGRDDSFEATRHNLKRNFDMLRNMAAELNIAVVTATQTNRKGLTQKVVTLEDISESYGKTQNADLIVTISRTLEDKEENTGRMLVAKNRNGPDGIVFPMEIDYGHSVINVLERQTGAVSKRIDMDKIQDAIRGRKK